MHVHVCVCEGVGCRRTHFHLDFVVHIDIEFLVAVSAARRLPVFSNHASSGCIPIFRPPCVERFWDLLMWVLQLTNFVGFR